MGSTPTICIYVLINMNILILFGLIIFLLLGVGVIFFNTYIFFLLRFIVLRVGTLFSGIGAFEFALKRLGLDHELVFACDSGNINPFSISLSAVDEISKAKVLDLARGSILGDDYFRDLEVKVDLCKDVNSLEHLYEVVSVDLFLRSKPEGIKSSDWFNQIYSGMSLWSRNLVYKSFAANYDVGDWHHDIRFLNGVDYPDLDFIVGGSPCQSFSVLGNRAGLNDARGNLVYEFYRVISESKPKVFIFENVANILREGHGKLVDDLYRIYSDLGYVVHGQVLNAVDYGIPQNRRRFFMVGIRSDLSLKKPFSFPARRVLNLFLKDVLESDVDEKFFLSDRMIRYVEDRRFNKRPKYLCVDPNVAFTLTSSTDSVQRMGIDTFVTQGGRLRRLTPRECLRIMGFTDDFKQVVSDSAMYRQAGNSIVVDVLISLVRSVLDSVDLGG